MKPRELRFPQSVSTADFVLINIRGTNEFQIRTNTQVEGR